MQLRPKHSKSFLCAIDREPDVSFFLYYIIPGMGHGGGPGINTPPNMLDAVSCWREKGIAPDRIQGRRVVAGKTELEMPLFPYPNMAGWDSEKSCFKPVVGPRAGVERVAASFRPAAAE